MTIPALNKFFCLLFLLLGSAVFAQTFTLKAYVTGFPDGTVFLLKNYDNETRIAVATSHDGRFEMTGALPQPSNLVLSTTLDDRSYYCFFLIGNEEVTLTADKNDLPFYAKVSGSKYESENEVLKRKNRAYDKWRDSISENIFDLVKDTSAAGQKRIRQIARAQAYLDSITDKNAKEFVLQHANTYAGVFRLYIVKKKLAPDTVRHLYAALSEELKRSFYGQALANFLANDVLNVGDAVYNFAAQDAAGAVHNLREFNGKFVLLDFMETHCVPCVQSIDELRAVAAAYKNDLVVVSFCADKTKDVWLTGLARDRPSWLCLWDAKGTTGETLHRYGVITFPTFVLVDRRGKIVYKETGYAKDGLQKIVGERLKR